MSLLFPVPPGIANVSNDQVVCEGSLIFLSCNATGIPPPNITWTRVKDDGTDSEPLLPVVDGKYATSNIQRNTNRTYRCTADNGVGAPFNRTVRVEAQCKLCSFFHVSERWAILLQDCFTAQFLCIFIHLFFHTFHF